MQHHETCSLTLPTQFDENTQLFPALLNGELVWRIRNDDISFHFHTAEVVDILKSQLNQLTTEKNCGNVAK